METDLRAMGRAVLVAMVLVAAGCSFKDKGINTTNTVVDTDADVVGGGTGGTAGGPTGTGGVAGVSGTGGSHLDGSVTLGDGPSPVAGDASTMGSDAPPLALGAACGSDGACASGFCTDGFCCDKRCGDPCFSCNATPGTCKPEPASTVCGSAACMGSTHTPAPRCDGNGGCAPPPAAACPNNLTCASATACRTKCAADNECTGGMVCDVAAGTCRPPGKPNGQVCAAGSECSSGNCADKVCCDLACVGTCRSCKMAQTGKPDGTCANVTAGVKDANCTVQEQGTCGRDGTCDGAGHCRNYPNGTRCATQCCSGSGGPGGGEPRVCAYTCNNGTCDRNNPTVLDRCGGAQCCCPSGGGSGVAACTAGFNCPLGTCVQ